MILKSPSVDPQYRLVLRWKSDGDVEIVQTGNPSLDKLPPAFRQLTPEYQTIRKERFVRLFNLLAYDPPPSIQTSHGLRQITRRLRKLIRRSDELQPFTLRVSPDFSHIIVELIRPLDEKTAVDLIWEFAQHNPSLHEFELTKTLAQYYGRHPRRVQSFLNRLKSNSQMIALTNETIRGVIHCYIRFAPDSVMRSQPMQQLLIYALRQYQDLLVRQLDGALAWGEDDIERMQLIKTNLVYPFILDTSKQLFSDALADTAESVLATIEEMEELYERRTKNP